MSDQPCQVPLIERLRSVPIAAHEMVEIAPTHHRNIPYGAMCHESANALDSLKTRLEKLECAAREDVISARIIAAENKGRSYVIDRDARFILQRCEAALAFKP